MVTQPGLGSSSAVLAQVTRAGLVESVHVGSVVVTDPDGCESLQIRDVATLTLSFDHRHVDGESGSRFLADVAAIMEDPATALLF